MIPLKITIAQTDFRDFEEMARRSDLDVVYNFPRFFIILLLIAALGSLSIGRLILSVIYYLQIQLCLFLGNIYNISLGMPWCCSAMILGRYWYSRVLILCCDSNVLIFLPRKLKSQFILFLFLSEHWLNTLSIKSCYYHVHVDLGTIRTSWRNI